MLIYAFWEQAGTQSNRRCSEHIVTLRLLNDNAKKRELKLFVTFVDITKAHDKVPRGILFMIMKRFGCGLIMLSALAVYHITQSVLGTAVMTATLEYNKALPPHVFVCLQVNELIRIIKEACDVDGFLGWLHMLVLMDETVLLARTRESMTRKINLLSKFCDGYEMVINQQKTILCHFWCSGLSAT